MDTSIPRPKDRLGAEPIVPDSGCIAPGNIVVGEYDRSRIVQHLQAIVINDHAKGQAGLGPDLDDVIRALQLPDICETWARFDRASLQYLHVLRALE